MGISEIVIIMAIALLLFGPEDLPDIARSVGRVFFEIRKATQELGKEFQNTIDTPANIMNKAFEQTTSPRVAPQEIQTNHESKKAELDEELLTYEDEKPTPEALTKSKVEDPLAELPLDMVSYEEKGASR